MQTTYIWNKLDLRRNKVILLGLIFFLGASPTFGQGMFGLTSTSGSDDQPLSYGFFLAAHTSTLRIKYSDAFLNPNSVNAFTDVRSIQTKFSPGFSLGFIGILRLHDQVSLMFTPKVGFYEYKTEVIYFRDPLDPGLIQTPDGEMVSSTGEVVEYSSEATMVELPLLLKYRSVRFNNTRMYWLGGASYQFRTKGQDEANVDDIVMTGQDVSLEAGMGFEIYFKYFKFAPEIRFSHGLMNAYQAENTLPELQGAIESIKRKSITIYLNFQ
ncbi:outer membrane protein with beta-barrel domain [Algoriphagus ratkowskyi]|uniref:Outer membrane protein with beta-barrel domain n=1 Tax=Algoriphagus ratkowskyi TaxID=57028 RepID=A0A2W7R6E5_9BACT|nr:porin family protein [Algoriphagus ratkowskyi]PZX54726.1 outer membrane protein with beta-barrel domain [Algoriphagus ratkowskyi]TXD77034.1 PorT family protein [Algoriphagus ratkowskyi]